MYTQWYRDLSGIAESDRAEFIRVTLRSKKMLPVFAEFFFSKIVQNPPELHYQIASYISDSSHRAIIVPRGHAKSTIARIDTVHDIVYKLEPFILSVGINSAEAKRSVQFIRQQLELNVPLIAIYGNLVPERIQDINTKWADSHIETNNGVSVLAVGKGKGRGLNIKGDRPTKAVIDDMEDRETIQSFDQRAKDKHWLYETLLPAMSEKGRVKMIGTVLHYDCLLLDFYKRFGGMKRAAVEDETGRPSNSGSPIWWKQERLDEMKRQIGTAAWSQEFQNEPMTDENSDVKLAWIKRCKTPDPVGYKVYGALDPAISEKQTADESAITVVFAKKDLGRWDVRVVLCSHGQWGATKTIDNSKAIYDRYNGMKFGVEAVAYQEYLRQNMNRAGIRAEAIYPKKDKRSRLLEIVGMIEFGDIQFCEGTEDLIEQLVQFPNGEHDDMVDSFVHAVKMATGGAGSLFVGSV